MFRFDERLADLIVDHCRRRLAADPVTLDYGGMRPPPREVLDGLICEQGTPAETVLDVFANELSTSILSSDSARYLAFIPSAPTKAAQLFDMAVSAASLPGTAWSEAAGAIVAENQALRFLADLADLPAQAGGCFVPGGSIGNLTALAVAREAQERRYGPVDGRPCVAVSSEAHASIALALRVVGIDPFEVRTPDHRLTGETLAAALEDDPDRNRVIGVVATAGTTNAGIVDDLAGVADVAAEHRLWLHVDGAYGGAALLVPSLRERFRGIERADSYVVDPHKWLFAPFDCAALLYRDPRIAETVMTQHASYLDAHRTVADDDWNPGDYALHLTRRPRGLPFWFSLAVHGVARYRRAVETGLELASRAAELIARDPVLELVREPELSIVLFRRVGWEDADYRAWSDRLLAEQRALVAPTTWEGRATGRLAFMHPDTPFELVESVLASMA
jgi:glutamate/tyrosine decarboxylase-like PLP-dependent enzyme